MSLPSCSFLQWFTSIEPAPQGHMVSLWRVKVAPPAPDVRSEPD